MSLVSSGLGLGRGPHSLSCSAFPGCTLLFPHQPMQRGQEARTPWTSSSLSQPHFYSPAFLETPIFQAIGSLQTLPLICFPLHPVQPCLSPYLAELMRLLNCQVKRLKKQYSLKQCYFRLNLYCSNFYLYIIFFLSGDTQDWRHWVGNQRSPISLCLMAEVLNFYLNKCFWVTKQRERD